MSKTLALFKIFAGIFSLVIVACGNKNFLSSADGRRIGIIGGFPISGGEIEAVGALVFTEKTSGGSLFVPTDNNKICSAALIAPQVVLTAKHCASIFVNHKFGENLANTAFVLGSDAFHPLSIHPLVDSISDTTISPGGFGGIGSDLGFIYLAKPITYIKPLPIANYETLINQVPLGNLVTVIGYGVQNQLGKMGERLGGSMTLQGTSGAVFDLAFQSFEAFLQAVPQSSSLQELIGDTTTPEGIKKANRLYSETKLLPGLQVLLVPHSDQAMTCYSDSGGPLLGKVNGQLTMFGVNSWGLSKMGSACGYLAVEATFGENDSATWLFAQKARDYVPCENERMAGRCDGTKIIRCSAPGDGPVRILKHDCADEGLSCSMVPATIPWGDKGTGLDYGVRAECLAN